MESSVSKKKISKSVEFICKCSKVYFSESALLTHIKKKHDGNRKEFNPKASKNHKKTGRPKTARNDIQQLNEIGEFDHVFTEKIENLIYEIHEEISKDVLLDYTSEENDVVAVTEGICRNERIKSLIKTLNLDNELVLPLYPSVEEIFSFFIAELGQHVNLKFLIDLIKLLEYLICVINEQVDSIIKFHENFEEIEVKTREQKLCSIKCNLAGNFIVEGMVYFFEFYTLHSTEFTFFANFNFFENFVQKFCSFLFDCQLASVQLESNK